MKVKSWETYNKDAPHFPPFTCPSIDDAIEKLEELRVDNASLRDCVDYWKDTCSDLHDQLSDLIEWKREIKKYIRES